MGWEVRRGKRCYYRKVREGRKVKSVYCGSGERGEAAAREDAERRAAGLRPEPPPAARPPITRAEIVRRASNAGLRPGRPWRHRTADGYLARGALSSALRFAGIPEEEVARRGLALAGAPCAKSQRPAAASVPPPKPWV